MRKNYWRWTERLARHTQLCSISHLVVKLLDWRPFFHEYFCIACHTCNTKTQKHTHILAQLFASISLGLQYDRIHAIQYKRVRAVNYSTEKNEKDVYVFFGCICLSHSCMFNLWFFSNCVRFWIFVRTALNTYNFTNVAMTNTSFLTECLYSYVNEPYNSSSTHHKTFILFLINLCANLSLI